MGEESYAIGAMSGTSLDGLDLCLARFVINDDAVEFSLVKSETIDFPSDLHEDLKNVDIDGRALSALDFRFGKFIGQSVKTFTNNLDVENIMCVASHGQTFYHQPGEGGYTTQIGNGAAIAYFSGLICVNDFRSADVVRKGQGAPLVPIGDRDLFGAYDSCVNLGGFANVSYGAQVRVAYDICPVNFVLNRLAARFGKTYDSNGELAGKGIVNKPLLERLNGLTYYSVEGPKSLGSEWVEEHIMPLLNGAGISDMDLLATFSEHVAIQIASNIKGKTLFTGGGVYNSYLIDRIKAMAVNEIVIPDRNVVEFKEALIFAWLGLKRLKSEVNTLSSVTGALENAIGGAVYLP